MCIFLTNSKIVSQFSSTKWVGGAPPPFKALNPVVLGWVGGVGEGEGVIPPRGPTCQPFKILIVDMTLEQNRSELPVNINQRVNSMVGGGVKQ